MIDRIVHSARYRREQALGCVCAALLIAGTGAWADDAPGSAQEQASDSTDSTDSSAPASENDSETQDTRASSETRRPAGDEGREVSDQNDENDGSVDRALRKLATIPRPYVRRSSPSDRAKTAGSAQYRLPSGTRVIVIQPGSEATGHDPARDASASDVPRHSDGRASEPNRLGLQHRDAIHNSAPTDTSRLGLQHRDAIRNSVSSLPIGDDIHGESPDWQTEVIDGEIADRNDPRLRNARAISGPYAPYRPGYQRLPSSTRVLHDDFVYDRRLYAAPAGEYFRFGFVPGSRYERLHAKANARSDRLLNSADKFRARGIAYLREGRYRQAANAFKVSADTNHHDPAARLYAAHAYFAIGRYREAVDFLDRAFELQPKIAFLDYDLRDDYGRKADFDRHLGDLERALDRSPHDVDRLVLLGYVLCYTNQRDIAWEPLIKAYKRAPDNGLINRLLETAQPPDVELEKAGIELPDRR